MASYPIPITDASKKNANKENRCSCCKSEAETKSTRFGHYQQVQISSEVHVHVLVSEFRKEPNLKIVRPQVETLQRLYSARKTTNIVLSGWPG